MRFFAAFNSSPPSRPVEPREERADPQAQAAPAYYAPAPWPADQPPDDLDQRVRQIGEWQIGDWV